MASPTFITSYSSNYTATSSPKTVSVTTRPGDVIVVYAGDAGATGSINTPTGNGISFTLQQSITSNSSQSGAWLWTGVDATGGTNWTLSVSRSSSVAWGFSCLVFRGSEGIGASNKNNSVSGVPSVSLTTTQNNSALVFFNADWNAQSDSGRTWTAVNGVTPTSGNGLERDSHYQASIWTAYGAYYDDVGTAGSKSPGMGAPASQIWSAIAVEIKGISVPTFVDSAQVVYDSAPTNTYALPNPTNGGALKVGDMLLFQLAFETTSSTVVNITSAPTGAVPFIASTTVGGGANWVGGAVYYKFITSGEVASPPSTWNFGIDQTIDGSAVVVRYRAIDTIHPIAVSSPAGGYSVDISTTSTTSRTAPAVTTNVANALVIAGNVHRSGSNALVIDTVGWTEAADTSTLGGRSTLSAYRNGFQVSPGSTGTVESDSSGPGVGFLFQSALSPIQPAPVAEYSFSEGSGTTTADSSGNNHTLTGSGWAASAKNGPGAGFGASWTASSSGIGTGSATTYTFMAWVKFSLPTGGDYKGILTSTNTTPNGRWFEVSASGANILLDYYYGSGTLTATSTFPVDTATHVAVSSDGSTTTLYINGVASGSVGASIATNLSTTDWTIGAGNTAVGPASNDWIDEVRVFDSALNSDSIVTWMNTGINFTTPSAIIAWFRA